MITLAKKIRYSDGSNHYLHLGRLRHSVIPLNHSASAAATVASASQYSVDSKQLCCISFRICVSSSSWDDRNYVIVIAADQTMILTVSFWLSKGGWYLDLGGLLLRVPEDHLEYLCDLRSEMI
ncbi:hypothetical protein QQ045_021943 [Rhodiola kirilowii]